MTTVDSNDREQIIRKDPARAVVPPNLPADPADWGDLGWDTAQQMVDGLPDGGVNIAHECIDRHVAAGRGDRVAIRWWGRDGDRVNLTYADLLERSSRFAGVLDGLGVGAGEKVFLLTGRRPELYVSVLGALRHRTVVCTLFAAFGPEPIRQRLELGDGRVLITTPTLYRRKVAAFRDQLPGLQHVILLSERPGEPAPEVDGTESFDVLMANATPVATIPPTDREDPSLLHFTSGTTGKPKGARHVHGAVVTHIASARWALDLHDDDVYWCTADPGWVTGTSYGIIAPLALGVTSVVDEADFEAERWYQILGRGAGVGVVHGADGGADDDARRLAERTDHPSLRFIASVGEPLNPEAVYWGLEAFGLPIHDNWWQTETGGIMIANTAPPTSGPARWGGRCPAWRSASSGATSTVRSSCATAEAEEVTEPDVEGELALRPGWPSMFRGYLDEPERTRQVLRRRLVPQRRPRPARRRRLRLVRRARRRRHQVGSGHLIGPFEVESVLDGTSRGGRGRRHRRARPGLRRSWSRRSCAPPGTRMDARAAPGADRGFARKRLGAAVAPKEIECATTCPRPRAGRSCAACCAPASSACPRETSRPWRNDA
jgi:acetyl-CoA synthetase